MNVETMARLAKLPRIVGVKDAAGDLARPARTRHAIGPDFCQLSGDDITAAAFLGQGGHGCISVVANVAPKASAALQLAWRDGDLVALAKWRDLLTPLGHALFVEANPIPVKYALSLLGRCAPTVRLPLVEATPAAREAVDAAMRFANLLN
jgi:4-hydroxy-tetrahydrodipicolinate synthase